MGPWPVVGAELSVAAQVQEGTWVLFPACYLALRTIRWPPKTCPMVPLPWDEGKRPPYRRHVIEAYRGDGNPNRVSVYTLASRNAFLSSRYHLCIGEGPPILPLLLCSPPPETTLVHGCEVYKGRFGSVRRPELWTHEERGFGQLNKFS